MVTIHVAPTPDPRPHIHHHTDDLTDLLHRVRAEGHKGRMGSSAGLPRTALEGR
jgi:hypothetical protein